jgi:hypothetical protein
MFHNPLKECGDLPSGFKNPLRERQMQRLFQEPLRLDAATTLSVT